MADKPFNVKAAFRVYLLCNPYQSRSIVLEIFPYGDTVRYLTNK